MNRTRLFLLCLALPGVVALGLALVQERAEPKHLHPGRQATSAAPAPAVSPGPEANPSGWHFEGKVTRFDYQGRPLVVGTLIGPYVSTTETDAEFVLLNYPPRGGVPIGQHVKCRVYRVSDEVVSGDYPSSISVVSRLAFVEIEPTPAPPAR